MPNRGRPQTTREWVLMLIVMVGLPGTGKSTLAKALARALPGLVLNKDRARGPVSAGGDRLFCPPG